MNTSKSERTNVLSDGTMRKIEWKLECYSFGKEMCDKGPDDGKWIIWHTAHKGDRANIALAMAWSNS